MPKWEKRNLLFLGIGLIVGAYITFKLHIVGPLTVMAFIVIVIGLLVAAVGLIQMYSGEKGVSSDT